MFITFAYSKRSRSYAILTNGHSSFEPIGGKYEKEIQEKRKSEATFAPAAW
jgi:hypothetical protein